MLNDSEKQAFEALTSTLDAPSIERNVLRSLHRRRLLPVAVMAAGALGAVLTFTFSTPIALVCLALAGAALFYALSHRPPCTHRFLARFPIIPRPVARFPFTAPAAHDSTMPPPAVTAYIMHIGALVDGSPQWLRAVTEFERYVTLEGNALVPLGHMAGDLDLGAWVALVRLARRVRRLTLAQVIQLDQLGMVWDSSST